MNLAGKRHNDPKMLALQNVVDTARSVGHPVRAAGVAHAVIDDPGMRARAHLPPEDLRRRMGAGIGIVQIRARTANVDEAALKVYSRNSSVFCCNALRAISRRMPCSAAIIGSN